MQSLHTGKIVGSTPTIATKMHSVALRCGRKCLSILGTMPLKLQLEFSQKNIAPVLPS